MKILLGKAKTGKSKYIYESIKEDLKLRKQPILFVPSQKREVTEIGYMDTLNLDGIIGVNITTISKYISSLCKSQNIHFDDNYISKLDKKIILNKIINENQDIFKVFKKVSKKQGFLDILNIYMDIFRKENIDTAKIEELNITNKVLENKLKEISNIYLVYKNSFENKYVDNVDEMDLILKKKEYFKEYFKNTVVYIDGYNNFTNIEYKFVELMISLGIDITISLVTDITNIQDVYLDESLDIFEESNKTYSKLLKIANKYDINVDTECFLNNYSKADECIKYLAQNIFDVSLNKYNSTKKENSVFLNIYQSVYNEIEEVAKKIAKGIRNGKRYSDFAIYTTDLDNYSFVISRIFYEYDIPFYVDTKKSIESSKLVVYIMNLLNLARKNDVESILDILKLGLNDLLEEDISYLENYILEFDITRYGLKNKFYLNNENYGDIVYDLDRLNDIRENVNSLFDGFISNISSKNTVKDYITSLHEHLTYNNIFKNFEKYLLTIEDSKYQIYSVNIENQVWGKICEVFSSILKIYGDEELNISNFIDILSNILKDVFVKTIPPTKDNVIIADINVTKLEEKKEVFFIGVTEGNFPKVVEQDILFSDFEIESLKLHDVEFKETSLSKENMAKYNIYEAINNVSEKLYISMPSTNIMGESTRKSSLISSICDITGEKVIGNVTSKDDIIIDYSMIYSKSESFEYMVKLLNDLVEKLNEDENLDNYLENAKVVIAIYSYLLKDERYSKIIEYIKSQKNLEKDTVEKIYKSDFKSSVYKLEMFKKCPFSYYLNYVLNISKRKIFEITSMDTGTFMHNVIEKFSEFLFNNNYVWHEIIENENSLKKEFKEALDKIILNELDNVFKKQKNSVKYEMYAQKLTNTLRKVVVVIARSFNQSEFVPFGYEIEFKENGKFLPIEIKLNDGKIMKIVGKIDRIDVLNQDDKIYVRVVDYKSSKKTLTLDDIKEGISLQLVTYLDAFLQNEQRLQEKQVLPAGCVYFNLSNNLVNLKDYTKDEVVIKKEIIQNLRLRGIFLSDVSILEKMDKKVSVSDEKLIDISLNRLDGSKKALNEEEFSNLCNDVNNILKDIGNDMIKGIVSISKNKKGKHCKYCDYGSICRKNSVV